MQSASAVSQEQTAIPEGRVGDDVAVPPIVQSFIQAYKAGRVKEALAVIFDPLLALVNNASETSESERDQLLDALAAMRGMLRVKMGGSKGDLYRPVEIRVIRSFKIEKDRVRVHLMIQHKDDTYCLRLITQNTPVGVIVMNIGFGDKSMFDE